MSFPNNCWYHELENRLWLVSHSLKIIIIIPCAGFLMLAACGGSRLTESRLTVSQRTEAEAGRDAACDTLRRLEPGMFSEIQPGDSGPIHVLVNQEFYEVPIYEKETALKAVALCYLNTNRPEQQGVVIVHDGASRKVIGRFDLNAGLSLD